MNFVHLNLSSKKHIFFKRIKLKSLSSLLTLDSLISSSCSVKGQLKLLYVAKGRVAHWYKLSHVVQQVAGSINSLVGTHVKAYSTRASLH